MKPCARALVRARLARSFTTRPLHVSFILVLVFAAAGLGCSQRFQREVDREMKRIYNPAVSDVCQADAEEFCSGAASGSGRRATCLAEHKSELSADCRAVVSGREDARTACKSELVNLCKETGDRPQLRVRCLSRRTDQLSAGCKAALEDADLI